MKLPPEPLTAQEVASLVGATGAYPSGVRNRALIVTLYWTGLRISEALALMPRDIDGDKIRVRHGKGDVSRVVNLPVEAQEAIAHWFTLRERYANGRHPIFCQITRGREGGAINPAYIRALLPRLGRKAGIEKRVHAHGLRHSCALRIVANGGSFLHVQRQLGHKDASTTAAYLRWLGGDELLNELRDLDK